MEESKKYFTERVPASSEFTLDNTEVEQLQKELALRKEDIRVLKESIELKEKRVTTLLNEADVQAKKIMNLEKELTQQKELFVNLQDKYTAIETENKKLKASVQNTYNPKDISSYFSQTIEAFNNDTSSDTDQVRYIINSMDVDLKAHIFSDQTGSIQCSSPSLQSDSEASVSSIKLSIRAIPK